MTDICCSHPDLEVSIDAVLADPTASFALKAALRLWSDRDPVDAARDARTLCRVLEAVVQRRLAVTP